MKIRSITAFYDPPTQAAELERLAAAVAAAKAACGSAGYEVQTTRLATTPFSDWLRPLEPAAAIAAARDHERLAADHGFEYVSLGPALPQQPSSYSLIAEMLAATKSVFFSGVIAEAAGGIHMHAVNACAVLIQQAAGLEPGGFANLRFAALANVPAGSPFFPAAYAGVGQPALAFATQAADLAVEAFDGAADMAAARARLTATIQDHGQKLAALGAKMAQEHKISFGGIDFSLAPFPEERQSLGAAFERMGVPAVGLHGSLAAAAILTQAIDAARFPRAGFNGLLLPPLEDAVLARRAADGSLAVSDLLFYAAVCGTGLDTVPLPGDTPAASMAAVLLDLAALALRLDKPLTARLMPIPGKQAGDPVEFDFPFFADSRVMALRAAPLGGALAAAENIRLASRKPGK